MVQEAILLALLHKHTHQGSVLKYVELGTTGQSTDSDSFVLQ